MPARVPTSLSASPSRVFSRRVIAYAASALAVVLLALAAAAGWLYVEMRGSLAQLDGEAAMPGATRSISIERDALGIPTIIAASRADVARGVGFVHAQDRFFEMDLARRRAAGELSELFGSVALKLDMRTRVLRLRARAKRVIGLATPEQLALLAAYVEGVNAGLNALEAKPPEYLALRTTPRPWIVEDSVLVLGSMFLTLQDSEGQREARLATVYEALPKPLADFFTSTASDWETPLSGEPRGLPVIPDASVFDVRTASPAPPRPPSKADASERDAMLAALAPAVDDARGSNNWAVAGRLTSDGGAIVANDMHLGLATPNIWYRASMAWQDSRPHRVTGVTLPGVPSLVAGSNGDVAWGFTNSNGDWTDLVLVESDPADASRYRTPSAMQLFEVARETIAVKGGASVPVDVRETIWGPIVSHDSKGRDYAVAWIPLHDGGMNLEWGDAETAETLEQLFEVAARAGVPAQNMVAAQRDGRIGWTIAGRIPKRLGYDGRLPTSWADGNHRWGGWIAPAEYPRVIDPPNGLIVTANNRLVDGEVLTIVGDSGYDTGARARQIRDDLEAMPQPSVRDMLRVQLDDRAVFLSRWRDLLLQVLSAPDAENSETRRELRRVVSDKWKGRASPDSAAYRIVREFRMQVASLAFAPLIERIRQLDPEYSLNVARGGEGPLWALMSERPAHLLDPKFKSWSDLLLRAADLTVTDAQKTGGIASYTWGGINTVRIRHPFSTTMPMLGPLLDMPTEQLPGDSNMPRVQGPTSGASERFAVSPGREKEGYFHMPTGQSGHPLSPHYRDANPAWVNGEATAFDPGPAVHTLTLTAVRSAK